MIAYLPTLLVLALGFTPAVLLIVRDLRAWRATRRRRPFCIPCAEPMRHSHGSARCPSCQATSFISA